MSYRIAIKPDNNFEAVVGSIVYDAKLAGIARSLEADDTAMFGEPYIAVTFDPSGERPYFTMPTRFLEKLT